MAFVVVRVVRQLHPYFSTRQAKRVGTPQQWAVKLNAFDVRFVLTTFVKLQAMADFVLEQIPLAALTLELPYEVFVDGSSNLE